ncbi:TPA: hypothetical protein I8Y21_004598 [Klebsiella oxytoca]|uniref:Uncharacterized protein n=1 Tax=Klebsiella oxytoca TaxID=571 RepID=A0AAN5LBE2_KLEOX|nr:hypothetical protein [Klebsiella oxytoca]
MRKVCFVLQLLMLLLMLIGEIPPAYAWVATAAFCLLCLLEAVMVLAEHLTGHPADDRRHGT